MHRTPSTSSSSSIRLTPSVRAGRGTRRVASVATAVVATLVLGACTADWDPAQWDLELPAAASISELRRADDCDSLVDAARPMLASAVDSMWPDDDAGWFSGGSDAEDSSASPQEGLQRSAGGPASTVAPAPATAGGADGAATSDAGTDAGTVIGTNNQEQGVDEADLVKTDGRRLVSVVNGVLRVIELDGSPTIDGTLDLSPRGATDLFLRGDSVLVLGTSYGDAMYGDGMYGGMPSGEGDMAVPEVGAPETLAPDTTVPDTTVPDTTVPDTTVPATTVPDDSTTTTVPVATTSTTTSTTMPVTRPAFPVATTLTLVSLSDPAAPVVTASADLEGSMVTAREQGGRARVVVQGNPVGMEQLSMSGSREAAAAVVDELDADDLLPRVSTDGRVDPVGGCDDVLLATSTTVAPAGGDQYLPTGQVSTVTVLTVGDDLTDLQPVSVQGNAETVYASTDSLFVASSSWDEAGSRTDVHRFALSGAGPAEYTGSGRAPGHLLDQFSLSERDGALRLVTTLDGTGTPMPIEPGGGMAIEDRAAFGASSARLTVLDTDGALDEIGHLDGMGIGEQVQSVRFLDGVAYVVTFRQTDPLYAIDLSDPRAPQLLGQLKIPGFSEYLHPVGDGLLLGVGRQVDPDTGMDEGLKISLFDVADPARMTEIDQIVLPTASSEVSFDHRAFLWDPTRSHAVIPVEGFCGTPTSGVFCDGPTRGAALVIGATRGGLTEVGRFSHEPSPGWALQPTRSVLVDNDLWSVSIAAVGRTDADTPSSVDLLPF